MEFDGHVLISQKARLATYNDILIYSGDYKEFQMKQSRSQILELDEEFYVLR